MQLLLELPDLDHPVVPVGLWERLDDEAREALVAALAKLMAKTVATEEGEDD